MWYIPGRCSWQKCQLLPQGWKHRWLDRKKWSLPSLNQCVPPDCASWPCPGQRGTQHSVLAGKEELKKRGSGGKAAKGSLGIHSCQLTACDGGGSAEQQKHSRTRKSLLYLGQHPHIAFDRRKWINGSLFSFIDLNTEGLQWFSFLIKRMLVWWIIAWLFAISRDVGGTALHVRDRINRSDLPIYIQLQKSHLCFCWSPTNPHLPKALLNRLYYRDIVISFLSQT